MSSAGAGPGVAVANQFAASKVPFQKFDESFIGSGVGHNYNGYGFYLTNKDYATGVRDQYHPGGAVQEAKIKANDKQLFNLDAVYGPVANKLKPDAPKVDPSLASKIEKFSGEALPKYATGRDLLYTLENVDTLAYRALFNDPTISTSQQGASRFLAAAGYKGNTYSDSYGQHYVIYNPNDLEVVGSH